MSSILIFKELEGIRRLIEKKEDKSKIEAAFQTFKDKCEIDPKIADEYLEKLRLELEQPSNEITEDIQNELLHACPTAALDKLNAKTYKILLIYAKLMYEKEHNGIPEEHAYKLSVLFPDPQQALKYIENFIKEKNNPNITIMHDANLYVLPSGNFTLKTWQELCSKYLNKDDFRNDILPMASDIEESIKQMLKTSKHKFNAHNIAQKTKEIQASNSRLKKLRARHGQLNGQEKSEYAELIKKITEQRSELTEMSIRFDKQLTMEALQAFREKIILDSSAAFKYFLNNGLTKQDYTKFIYLNRHDDNQHIPNIKIDGNTLNHPGFYLMKVDVMDEKQAARAACLGKLTGCCQSLSGEAGEPCVVHGLTSPYGGFYIICEGNIDEPSIDDPVIGQCWAWRSASEALVFDSIEIAKHLKNDPNHPHINMVRDFYYHLGQLLVTKGHTSKVACGNASGISSSVGQPSIHPAETFKDYSRYSDAHQQNILYDKNHPFYSYSIDEDSKQQLLTAAQKTLSQDIPFAKDIPFSTLINWALVYKKEDILNDLRALAKSLNKEDALNTFIEKQNQYINKTQYTKEEFLILLDDIKENRISPNFKNNMGDTFLICAIKNGFSDIAKKLLALGCPLQPDAMLTAAINASLPDIVELSLKHGANIELNIENRNTPLFYAAKQKNIEILNILIQHGANINAINAFGSSALIEAIESRNTEAALFLIDNEIPINTKIIAYNKTPLMFALEYRLYEVAEKLIDNGADLNEKDNFNNNTALMYAAKAGSVDIIEKLLAKGVDIKIINNSNETALTCAIKNKNTDAALYLINSGSDTHLNVSGNQTLLMLALEKDLYEVAEKLISNGADIHAKDIAQNTVLMYAAQAGSVDIVTQLLEKGVDVSAKNENGNSALNKAATHGNLEICKKILEKDGNLLDEGNPSPLHNAIECDRNDVCQFFITTGADINKKNIYGEPVIHSLSMQKNITDETLELAIQHGADVNSVDSMGQTPLMMAAKNGLLNKVSFLLEHDANLHLHDNKGNTALSLAIKNNRIDIVNFLLEHNPSIVLPEKNDGHASLLLNAIKNDHETMALRLLDTPFNFDISEVDPERHWSLLMHAIEHNLNAVAINLLEKGADIHYKTPGGNVALSLAAMKGNELISTALIEYGAKIDVKNNKNKTPIDIANDSDQSQLASKLEALSKEQERISPFRLSAKHRKQENITPIANQSPNLKQKK